MTHTLRQILDNPRFERVIIALIIVNAITLGLETSPAAMSRFGSLLGAIDTVILGIFVAELAARMAVRRGAFFRDPWSLFDLAVVAIALVPATDSLSVLRALRVLRVLRLVTAIPSLRRVVGGLIAAMPGMGSIGLLLGILFYVFAVVVTKLYGEAVPDQFGTLGASAYTLFQAMTFDDWSNGIVKPLTEKGFAFGWFVIILFMVVSAFMALNLFIGVVVTALDSEAPQDDTAPLPSADVAHKLDAVMAELAALRAELARQAPTTAPASTGGSRA